MAIRIDPVLHTMPQRIQDEFRREVAGTRRGPISDAVLPLNGALLDRQQRIDGLNVKVQRQADRIEHLERVLVQAREALKDSDVRVYELCSTFSTPEPEATRKRTADAIAAIDEALKEKT